MFAFVFSLNSFCGALVPSGSLSMSVQCLYATYQLGSLRLGMVGLDLHTRATSWFHGIGFYRTRLKFSSCISCKKFLG